MLALAAALGLVMGLVIGALGGGGGVLTVPLLVYVLGLTAQSATTSSIIIVGITALFGTLARLRGNLIDWRTGLTFGILGIPAAYLGTLLNHAADQRVLLLVFAAITILAATAMLINNRSRPDARTEGEIPDAPSGGKATTVSVDRRQYFATATKVVLSGLAIGFMTGFLGVGGGFLVVPALVIILRMPMTYAIGTSLLIITLNSVSSMASRLGSPLHLDWRIVVPFTVLAIVGSLLGKRIADRFSGDALTNAFAVMLILVGGYVAANTLGAI
ncbi:sulfite exporter TauE/SafE family protein [Pseudonocardia sp. GCM10023141]|uniref:sulfite exporter TauE/SafE family protein n=1 Tax=Pseudonocardia sp. GCM10023141 TaxID=3252653 RepID=UPI00361A0026